MKKKNRSKQLLLSVVMRMTEIKIYMKYLDIFQVTVVSIFGRLITKPKYWITKNIKTNPEHRKDTTAEKKTLEYQEVYYIRTWIIYFPPLCKWLVVSVILYETLAHLDEIEKKNPRVRNKRLGKALPHLLLGAQDQSPCAEQYQMTIGPTGISQRHY